MTTTVLPPHRAPLDHADRVSSIVVEVLCAIAVLLACCGLLVNWLWVYVRFFSVAPDLNPVTIGLHRGLMIGGTAALVAMTAAGLARGGWRWTVVARTNVMTVLFVATAVQLPLEGAVPGLG